MLCRYRKNIVENVSAEPDIPPADTYSETPADAADARMDTDTLLAAMDNPRYRMVIRRLILDETPPDALAIEMGVTIDNLYNIKRRAMACLTSIALKLAYK